MDSSKDPKFTVKLEDLIELMALKPEEAKHQLSTKFNGTKDLADKLCTDLNNGINAESSELEERLKLYGKNEIPLKNIPISILSLASDAIQSPKNIVLIIYAILTIYLSTYGENNSRRIEGILIMIFDIISAFVYALYESLNKNN